MNILGIDPGLSGALSLWDGNTLTVHDMPVMEAARGKGNEINMYLLANIFNTFAFNVDHAYIEQVGAMPGQGVSSMFKFGICYGMVRQACACHGIPTTLVPAMKWKGHMGLSKDKNESLARACELFPIYSELFARKKDNGRAEATLIALYGFNEEAKR